ncbi:MAG: hypothetical protein AAB873_02945 [Patescibacteria group bacterium]
MSAEAPKVVVEEEDNEEPTVIDDGEGEPKIATEEEINATLLEIDKKGITQV